VYESVYLMTPTLRVSDNEGTVIVFTSTSCLRF
jgi:hypothetical protein